MKLGELLCWVALLVSTTLSAVIGIDYGQEFVKSSLVAPGAPFEIILSADSKRKEVAGITFKPGSSAGEIERVYGNSANNLFTRFPASSLFYSKQLLGKSLDEITEYHSRFPAVDVVPATNNRSAVAFQVQGYNYTVEEIVAMQFDDIKTRATALLASTGYATGSSVRDVAITVPPFFNSAQRQALIDATDIAGLKLISLVNDGLAVAVNFASTRQFSTTPEYYIIFDVGAGSTSATLVSINQGDVLVDSATQLTRPGTIIDVHGVGYDEDLGGQHFTSRLRDVLLQKFVDGSGKKSGLSLKDIKADPRAMNKFWREAEKVKNVLSANSEGSASIESAKDDVDFRAKISRDEFETAVKDITARIGNPIRDALQPLVATEKAIGIKNINAVILAGGSSRVPVVQQHIIEAIGGDASLISKNVNADEAAVLGATLRGVGISKIFRSRDMKVTDRAIWDYDLTIGGKKVPLFPRGTPLDSIVPVEITEDGTVGLQENGKNIAKYEISGFSKAINDLKNDSYKKCLDETNLRVDATFKLNLDRTVELVDVAAKCAAYDKPKLTTSTTASSATSDEGAESEPVSDSSSTGSEPSASETESTSTTTAPAEPTPPTIRTLKKHLRVTTKTFGTKALGYSNKNTAITKLRGLKRQDIIRLEKEQLRNDIESLIYQVREYLVTNEVGNDHDLLALNNFSEWLEEVGHQANVTDLAAKAAEIVSFRDKFKNPGDSDSPAETVSEAVKGTVITEPAAEAETPLIKYEPDQKLLEKVKIYKDLISEFHSIVAGATGKGSDEQVAIDLLDVEAMLETLAGEEGEKTLDDLLTEGIKFLGNMNKAAKGGDTSKLLAMKGMIKARQNELDALRKNDNKLDRQVVGIAEQYDNAIKSIEVNLRQFEQQAKKEEAKTKIEHDDL